MQEMKDDESIWKQLCNHVRKQRQATTMHARE